ncbi:MAG: c-type cytochrome [Rhodopila sp.]
MRHLLLAAVVMTAAWTGVGSARAQDAAAGQTVFKIQCATCHSVAEGKNMVGPSLYGLVGRQAGQIPQLQVFAGEQGLRPDLGCGDTGSLYHQPAGGGAEDHHAVCGLEGRAETRRSDRIPGDAASVAAADGLCPGAAHVRRPIALEPKRRASASLSGRHAHGCDPAAFAHRLQTGWRGPICCRQQGEPQRCAALRHGSARSLKPRFTSTTLTGRGAFTSACSGSPPSCRTSACAR